MKIDEFVKQVKEMREAQKEFFRLRKKGDFINSKTYLQKSIELEREVDKSIKVYMNPQTSMFDVTLEKKEVIIEKNGDYTMTLITLGFNVRVINCEDGQPLVYLVYDKMGKLLGRTGNNSIAEFLSNQGYHAKFIEPTA